MEDKGVCEESETSQPQNITPAAGQGPLVSVTFQTDPHRKLKYLESEPKALGGVVAGSLALAAQNLHLPTLKACLGMQVVACVVSILNLLMEGADLGLASNFSETCWMSWNDNSTGVEHDNCMMLSTTHAHYTAENLLIQAVSVAISVTLAAYCCKVINCCSPTSRMPVITVQAPSTLR
ncbi:uncharacterized protein LOC124487125 isoform X2 [Hypomesus transpacificus]|uniref:uncharacterized protein LOC124487125 isoform X2 n=1 Tax=Hypomesus transpacificus TaxID=137520 RepID=UPI001F081481|nr:uncharacterized protein LOC124487125 isoform X2 [Hypomesus transpacificus]